ncbi:MAG: hypothetical protein SGBAC_012113 [Bacillariaceae sp.]
MNGRLQKVVLMILLQLLVSLPSEILGFSPARIIIGSYTHPRRIRHQVATLPPRHSVITSSNTDNNNNNNNNNSDRESLDRLGGVRQAVSEIADTGLKDIVQAGDVIIAKVDLPRQQIYANEGYRIVSIYDQVVDKESGQVKKTLVDQLDDITKSGYTRYLKLQVNAKETAIVTPEEIGLVTLKDELTLSLWLAVPGFFWVVVAWNFAHYYTERYGGNFMDAMFRT